VQDLQTYAGTANLDVKSFTACVESGRMKGRVAEDIAAAERIGVKATPTLVINGRLFEGLLSPERFATVLEIETRQAAKEP
jgi:predicted DsbA family dithiol-disulfide isomerase